MIGPFPAPSGPWQGVHWVSKTTFPRAITAGSVIVYGEWSVAATESS
jgi:hypothetical protein